MADIGEKTRLQFIQFAGARIQPFKLLIRTLQQRTGLRNLP